MRTFLIKSDYGKYLVSAINVSEARYKYSSILSDREDISWDKIYNSIITSQETSARMSSCENLSFIKKTK